MCVIPTSCWYARHCACSVCTCDKAIHYDSVVVSDRFEKACCLVVPSIKQEPTAFIFKASDDAGSRFLCRRYGVMTQNTSLNLHCTENLTYLQGFSANWHHRLACSKVSYQFDFSPFLIMEEGASGRAGLGHSALFWCLAFQMPLWVELARTDSSTLLIYSTLSEHWF